MDQKSFRQYIFFFFINYISSGSRPIGSLISFHWNVFHRRNEKLFCYWINIWILRIEWSIIIFVKHFFYSNGKIKSKSSYINHRNRKPFKHLFSDIECQVNKFVVLRNSIIIKKKEKKEEEIEYCTVYMYIIFIHM